MSGRPLKQTVDYFPHDAVGGKTLFILQSRFGNNGYAVWFKLLALLCRTPGHAYSCLKAPDWQFLVAEMALSPGETLTIVDCLAELEAIDPELWKEKVIWSQNLVNRLAPVYHERKTVIPIKPKINGISPPINSINPVDNSPKDEVARISPPDNTHSKVKESKVNKNIKESNKEKTSKIIKSLFGIANNVLLSQEERDKLTEKFGGPGAIYWIDKLSSGIESKGYKYKSHYFTILNWAQRDGEKKSEVNNGKPEPRQAISTGTERPWSNITD